LSKRRWDLLLLAGVPVAAALEFFSPQRHTAIFVAAVVAIVPLAAYIGQATDDLAGPSWQRAWRIAERHVR
jgi:Ca2+:H+ antiporter